MKHHYLTTSEMKALETHAVEKYNVSLEQMMQNAGKAVFDVVMNEVIRNDRDAKILVISGKGNNGGDALVTARLLAKNGIDVSVFTPYKKTEFSPMAKAEFDKLTGLVKSVGNVDSNYDLIIDALFGFSLTGNPYAKESEIIEQINCSQTPVLSVDVPSGLDVHNGKAGDPTVTANYTVALGMPKCGMRRNFDIVGRVFIGNLGIPKQAYKDFGYDASGFRDRSYLSL